MIVILLALLAPVSSINSPHSKVQTGYGKPNYNPSKMICVSKNVTGSRLQEVRECHTAQQWEDQAEQEKVGLARQQMNGDHPQGPGNRDTPW